MRRTAAALLVVVFAAVACGGSSEPKGDSLSGSITVAAAGGEGEIAALKKVVEQFMRDNPGTTVQLDAVGKAGELVAKLTAAFLASRAPDVFVLNYRRVGPFVERKVIEPVSGIDTSGLFEKPLEAFTFDGTLLCAPSNASNMVVYVNRALFAKAGVELPSKGWTWDDMLAKAKALAAKKVSAIGFETGLIRMAPFVWSNGGEVVDDMKKPTMIDLSSPEAREAIGFLLDLQKTGMSATDRAAQEPEAAFAAGKIAMYLDSRRVVPSFRKADGLDFDVAPVPSRKTAVTVLHSDGYCVTKASKNKALARAFAAYAVTGNGAVVLAENGRTVPMSTSLAASESFLAPGKPPASSQVFVDQLSSARAFPHHPAWNEAEEVAEDVLTQLFAGRLTLDAAIERLRRDTARELSR